MFFKEPTFCVCVETARMNLVEYLRGFVDTSNSRIAMLSFESWHTRAYGAFATWLIIAWSRVFHGGNPMSVRGTITNF